MDNTDLLQCYNRGCGQKYHAEGNSEKSCRHHPGEPFFHDAYKGWSCCNKKCTDFTEFLNIKGCTSSKHSNIKPPEPEKPAREPPAQDEVIEVKPIVRSVQRPAYDTPLVALKPEIAPSLKQQVTQDIVVDNSNKDDLEITIGSTCKHGGCGASYKGPEANETVCIYHPGVPIFHEGLKFWSCCQRRTTDFDVFLNQVGCETGKHLWRKEDDNSKTVQCRWDFHQTGSHVIVSIYAKQYCLNSSVIKLNPIRLFVNLVFPQQSGSMFNLDLELCGVVNVSESHVTMFGTKVEIKLKKAEPGTWTKLEIPKKVAQTGTTNVQDLTPKVEGVDLGDL